MAEGHGEAAPLPGIVRQVKVRLAAAKGLLQELRGVRHQSASSSQRVALEELLNSRAWNSVGAEVRADLVGRATEIRWHDNDLEPVLKKLQPCVAKEKRPQRGSQVFLAFPDFLDEDKWKTLLDKDVSMAAKRVLILMTLSGLNVTTPCERTTKLANSLWMCCTLPDLSELRKVPTATKKLWLNEMKKEFDAIQRRCHHAVHIRQYPDSVEAFKEEYPEIYRRACPKPPVKCKISLEMLSEVEASYKCRGDGKPAVPTLALQPAQQPQQPQLDGGMQVMAQFMTCLMGQIRQQPSNVLAGLLNGAPSAKRMTRPPLCLGSQSGMDMLKDALSEGDSQPQHSHEAEGAPDHAAIAAPSAEADLF